MRCQVRATALSTRLVRIADLLPPSVSAPDRELPCLATWVHSTGRGIVARVGLEPGMD